MEITLLTKLILSVILAVVIGGMAGFIVKRGNDAKVGLGCGLMFPIAIGVFVILQIIIPDVVVVTYSNGECKYCEKTIFGSIKTSTGHSFKLSLCGQYIANLSNESLICYQTFYGTDNYYNTLKEEEPIIIAPNSVLNVEKLPDYYFSLPPDQISSKSSGWETKWVLDRLPSVMNEYRSEE